MMLLFWAEQNVITVIRFIDTFQLENTRSKGIYRFYSKITNYNYLYLSKIKRFHKMTKHFLSFWTALLFAVSSTRSSRSSNKKKKSDERWTLAYQLATMIISFVLWSNGECKCTCTYVHAWRAYTIFVRKFSRNGRDGNLILKS